MGWGCDWEGIVDFGAEGAGQPGHGARAGGLSFSAASPLASPFLAYVMRQRTETWGF